MLGYFCVFFLGSTLGFFTCAFFVGANQRRWEEMHRHRDLNERNDDND